MYKAPPPQRTEWGRRGDVGISRGSGGRGGGRGKEKESKSSALL